jgi:tRNA-(ms[2]io[6]A)-hydroxylase
MTSLLRVATPESWFACAAGRLDELLLDHASCEKKAASTALALMFAYPEDAQACTALARLAREELRHFEQVESLRRELGIEFRRLSPSRYASGLRRCVRSREPGRRVDLLLLGAFIEARSCERFQGLQQVLMAPVGALYAQLEASEARHQSLYLQLAQRLAADDVTDRIASLADAEAELVSAPDPQFRFHSGRPA